MKGRTSDESRRKRQAVARKYDELIGRNHYSQPLRDYCYRKRVMGTITATAPAPSVMHTRKLDMVSAS
ncbi:hypothetical protein [Enterocloster sp.]|uniref:hypothetical protein n=1 Tax=Enterocloster sp. TaxID=2719315 RepID=UPI00399FF108